MFPPASITPHKISYTSQREPAIQKLALNMEECLYIQEFLVPSKLIKLKNHTKWRKYVGFNAFQIFCAKTLTPAVNGIRHGVK